WTLAAVNAPTSGGPAPLVSTLQAMPGGVVQNLLNAAYLAWVSKLVQTAAQEKVPETLMLPAFARRWKETAEEYALVELPKRLVETPQPRLLRDQVLDPADTFFDV